MSAGGLTKGLVVGAGVAMIVDWSMAWAPVSIEPSSPSPSVSEQHSSPAHNPRIAFTAAGVIPSNNGASLVLGGRF